MAGSPDCRICAEIMCSSYAHKHAHSIAHPRVGGAAVVGSLNLVPARGQSNCGWQTCREQVCFKRLCSKLFPRPTLEAILWLFRQATSAAPNSTPIKRSCLRVRRAVMGRLGSRCHAGIGQRIHGDQSTGVELQRIFWMGKSSPR